MKKDDKQCPKCGDKWEWDGYQHSAWLRHCETCNHKWYSNAAIREQRKREKEKQNEL